MLQMVTVHFRFLLVWKHPNIWACEPLASHCVYPRAWPGLFSPLSCYPPSISFGFSLSSWLPDPEEQNHHCHHCTALAPNVHHWDFCRPLMARSAIGEMYRQDISVSQGYEGGVFTGVKRTVTRKKIVFAHHVLGESFNSWQLSWN